MAFWLIDCAITPIFRNALETNSTPRDWLNQSLKIEPGFANTARRVVCSGDTASAYFSSTTTTTSAGHFENAENVSEYTALTLPRLAGSSPNSTFPCHNHAFATPSGGHSQTSLLPPSHPPPPPPECTATLTRTHAMHSLFESYTFESAASRMDHHILSPPQTLKTSGRCRKESDSSPEGSRKASKDVEDGGGQAVVSRASYMCRKCKAHGQAVPVKRHKRACPYLQCRCLKCRLVDQGRKVSLLAQNACSLYFFYKVECRSNCARVNDLFVCLTKCQIRSIYNFKLYINDLSTCAVHSYWLKVVARQIALYRDQKGHSNGSGGAAASSHPRLQRDDTTRHRLSTLRSNPLLQLPIPKELLIDETRVLPSLMPPGVKVSPSPALISGGGRQVAGPHCRRCRNHNVAVTWKGHKKSCPYRNCPCDPCRLINVRKDTEKTLRDMVRTQYRFFLKIQYLLKSFESV